MISLSYSYLDHVKHTKGYDEYYKTVLQYDLYKQIGREVLMDSNQILIDKISTFSRLNSDGLNQIDNQLYILQKSYESEIQNLTDIVDMGFEKLDTISDELYKANELLGWGFNTLIEQSRVSNLLLSNIAELLKIPEFEKERLHFIQEGLSRIQKAFYDADFYSFAIKSFQKSLERDETDYFSLFRLGWIYLFSPKDYDFKKANDFLQKSSKFLKPQVLIKSNSGIDKKYEKLSMDYTQADFNSFENISEQYSEIEFLLGVTYMLLGDYDKARLSFEESLAYNSSLTIKYNLIKANYFLEKNVIQDIDVIIDKQPVFFTKIKYDYDFISDTNISNLLTKKFKEVQNDVLNSLKEINSQKIPLSFFNDEILIIDRLLEKGYAKIIKAQRLLSTSRNVELPTISENIVLDFKAGNVLTKYKTVCGDLKYLVKSEAQFHNAINKRYEEFPNAYEQYLNNNKKIEQLKYQAMVRNQAVKWLSSIIIFILSIIIGHAFGIYILNFHTETGIEFGGQYLELYYTIHPIYFLAWIIFGFFLGLCIIDRALNEFVFYKKLELQKEITYFFMAGLAIVTAFTHRYIILNQELQKSPNSAVWLYIEFIIGAIIVAIIYLIPSLIIAFFISLLIRKES